MAVSTPNGIEITEDTPVTAIDPTISGKIPKAGGSSVGYQYFPKTKSLTETSFKIGSPSINKKIVINARVAIEASEIQKNVIRMIFSVLRLFFSL
jgi:hypothetical protein